MDFSLAEISLIFALLLFALFFTGGFLLLQNHRKRKQLKSLLDKEDEYFRSIFEGSPIGIELYDSSGKLVLANRSSLDIFGVRDVGDLKGLMLFADPNLPNEMGAKLANGEPVRYETSFDFEKIKRSNLYPTSKSGDIDIDVTITPLKPGETGRVGGYLMQVQDVTERKKNEETICEQQTFLTNAIESLPNPFYIVDVRDYTVKLANSAAYAGSQTGKTLTCYRISHQCEQPCPGTPGHPCPIEMVKETKKPVIVEHSHPGEDGITRYYEVHGYPILNARGDVEYMIEYSIEITERKRMEEELRVLSLMDELTGLYNRRGFRILAEKQLALADRSGKKLLFLVADIDNMKKINDNFGHKEGDIALISINNILRYTFRESDILARVGGDEFVVLSTGDMENRADLITERLMKNVREHNTRNNRGYELSVSVGVAYYDPRTPRSTEEILDLADKAMYRQKAHKKTASMK